METVRDEKHFFINLLHLPVEEVWLSEVFWRTLGYEDNTWQWTVYLKRWSVLKIAAAFVSVFLEGSSVYCETRRLNSLLWWILVKRFCALVCLTMFILLHTCWESGCEWWIGKVLEGSNIGRFWSFIHDLGTATGETCDLFQLIFWSRIKVRYWPLDDNIRFNWRILTEIGFL